MPKGGRQTETMERQKGNGSKTIKRHELTRARGVERAALPRGYQFWSAILVFNCTLSDTEGPPKTKPI